MLRYDKAEDMLYYGKEIVCEVGYAGPALDFIIAVFNKFVDAGRGTSWSVVWEKPEWREYMQQLQAIAQGRAEFRQVQDA